MKWNAEKLLLCASVLVVMALFFYCAFSWGSLPQKIPAHFGLNGHADSWAPKGMLWVLPILYLFIVTMGFGIRKFPDLVNLPFQVSEDMMPQAIQISFELVSMVNLQVGLMFGYITYVMVESSRVANVGLGVWFLPVVLIVLGLTIGWYLLRLKSVVNNERS